MSFPFLVFRYSMELKSIYDGIPANELRPKLAPLRNPRKGEFGVNFGHSPDGEIAPQIAVERHNGSPLDGRVISNEILRMHRTSIKTLKLERRYLRKYVHQPVNAE